MKKYKFSELFDYLPKSKIKAREGREEGLYPLFTSSSKLTKYFNKYIYEGESLIFGTGGLPSVHYINDKFSTSTDCLIVQKKKECEKKVDAGYVYYFFKSNSRILEDGFHGAGLKHISKKYISNIKIPLPKKIDDQIKIANLLTQVEVLIAKRKESLELLDALLRSTFLDMFIFNENKHKWKIHTLFDLAKQEKRSMRTGPFGSNLLHDEFTEEGDVAVLGIDNAVKNKFVWAKKRYITHNKYQELTNYTIYPEDVIITIMGTVGRSAVVPKNIPLAINTKHLAAISLNQNIANPYFIAYSIHSNPEVLTQIKNKTRGAIMGGFNLGLIKKLKLSLPPKPLQDKFATVSQQVEATKTHYQNSLDELNKLFSSLSQKAFCGELDLSKLGTQAKQDYSAADRLNNIEDEFKTKIDSLLGDRHLADTPDLEDKAFSLTLGYRFGCSDECSIRLIESFLKSDPFMEEDAGEANALRYIVENHDNPTSIIESLLKLILEKEQNIFVRQEAALLLSEYPSLDENTIEEITKIIENKENIEQEVRLITAEVFSRKIDIYPELKASIYQVLREDTTSPLSNKEPFVHFLEDEIKSHKDNLAFDTLVKVITADGQRATAYKMLFLKILKSKDEITGELINSYNYEKLKENIFRLLKKGIVKQVFNAEEKTIVLNNNEALQ